MDILRSAPTVISFSSLKPVEIPAKSWIWIVVCVVFTMTMVVSAWVGYLETDDLAYARAADGWMAGNPFLGQSHWALRHFIVLPLAVSFRVFGRNEFALAAPMLVYGLGLLLLVGLCTRKVAGSIAGAVSSMLIAAVPAFASGTTVVYTDVAEAFFVVASFWAFYFANSSRRPIIFLLAGLLAGCGFLTRETSVALLISYTVLFLCGFGGRGNYIWMAIGFLMVVGLDTVYLWLRSGDPFWRFHVTQRGVLGDSPYTAGLLAPAGTDDSLGVYSLPRPLQALVMLFASPAIGLLPWFGVPASAYLLRSLPPGNSRRALRLFVLLAVVWFTSLSFIFLSLWLIPRYQIVTVSALAVPSGILLAVWFRKRLFIRVAVVLLPIMAGGFALTIASDHALMFGERHLAEFMRHESEPIRTDPATFRGASWLLQNAGAYARVSVGLPVPGGLYLINHSPRRRLPADWPLHDNPPGSAIVASFVQQPGIIGRTAAYLALDRVMPLALWKKIQPPPRRAEVVRMPLE